ncbi:MAG: MGMT family protein [Acidobacteria bacterium]|nr:MGMT family protein [Acidobacteriota bacterium]
MRKQILSTVRKIPRGKVSSYGAVARAAGFPGAARQVVWALRGCGPDVPWHRVVGAGGLILLPREHGLEQRFRLEAEGVKFHGNRVRMDAHEHKWRRTSPAGRP